jgi:hypothetical protein
VIKINCSILFFELTLSIDPESFEEQFDIANRRAKKSGGQLCPIDVGYADESFSSDGIMIVYQNDSKKKKINMIVHPRLVIDNDDELWKPTPKNILRLIDRLDKLISVYFDSAYVLDDFKLSRIDFAVDIEVKNGNSVYDYIKVLRNIGRVKCFSPIRRKRSGIKKDDCFALKGNTNGVEFWAYKLEQERKTLRVEVRLIKKNTIQACTAETDTSKQIIELAERSETIFMNTFRYVVPQGDHYKKHKAMKLIMEGIREATLRRKMIRLMALIPEKKSLHLAQKSMSCRKIEKLMAAFAAIDVSPVTISKRHEIKYLKSLYAYL